MDTRPARDQLDLVRGEWIAPTTRLDASLDDPNTGEFRQHQLASSAETVDRALAAAEALHAGGEWEHAPVEARQALLERFALGLEERFEEIGYEDAMANGNPIAVATQLAGYLGPRVRSAAEQLSAVGIGADLAQGARPVRLLRRPLGPAVVLAPWNAPTFVGIAKVASALAAGCPVILKPSEWAPGGCQVAAELLVEAIKDCDLPTSLFQLLHGAAPVGAQLVKDPRTRAISFTGGGGGGRAVATAAAPHFTAVQLELGGHNPAIVLEDVDVQAAAAALAEGMTKLNGQWCEAPGKVLVHAARHDELVDALLGELAARSVGHCLEPGTDVGPLSHASHRDHLVARIEAVEAAGGKALTVNTLPDLGGWFLAPTVIVGAAPEDSERELFGPAVSIHAVTSDEAALKAAHGPETGLAGFVFGADVEAAMRVAMDIRAGEVRVNGCKLADLADGSEQTFWNAAGLGGHGPTDMVRFFQGSQVVGLDDARLPI